MVWTTNNQQGIRSFLISSILSIICIKTINSFSFQHPPIFLRRWQTPTSSYTTTTTTTTTHHTQHFMGLYDEDDEDLPELPKDWMKNRRTRDDIRNQKLGKFVNTDEYLPEEKDEFGITRKLRNAINSKYEVIEVVGNGSYG